MRDSLRQAVRIRDEFRCRYCGVTETHIGSTLTIDHIQPPLQGGDDSLDNLVYCCHPCNEFKSKYWRTEPDLRLLNPLVDDFAEYYREQDDGTVTALTERGANHIQRLHLNRPELIAHRLRERFYATREVTVAAMEEELRQLRSQRRRRRGNREN